MNTLPLAAYLVGSNIRQATSADAAAWGTAIESATRTVVAVAAACFVAGEALGRWVHQLNADLAAAYRCVLVGHRQAADALAPVAAATERFVLEALSVQQLRALARQTLGSATRIEGRRIAQAKKAALVAALA